MGSGVSLASLSAKDIYDAVISLGNVYAPYAEELLEAGIDGAVIIDAGDIDEILDEGLDGLKEFADETNRKFGWVGKWLRHKVGLEGNDQQKVQYKALENYLWPDTVTPTPNQYDSLPNPIPAGGAYRSLETPADYIRAGLPMNMTDMVHQPLQEVEVYRDLGGFELPEEAKPDEGEDEEKKAEGA